RARLFYMGRSNNFTRYAWPHFVNSTSSQSSFVLALSKRVAEDASAAHTMTQLNVLYTFWKIHRIHLTGTSRVCVRHVSFLLSAKTTPFLRLVLEQANPDVLLTSSQVDDSFMELLQSHSTHFHFELGNFPQNVVISVDANGGTFLIRPHKDFQPEKGRDR